MNCDLRYVFEHFFIFGDFYQSGESMELRKCIMNIQCCRGQVLSA